MRTLILMTVFAVSQISAQTTGAFGINDYTITCTGCATGSLACGLPAAGNGGTSGSTSGFPGTKLNFDASLSGLMTFRVTCAPGSVVQIFWSGAPCYPCAVPLPWVTYNIPSKNCGGAWTNQSIDLNPSAPIAPLFGGVANGWGLYEVQLTLPPVILGCFSFCSQAVILDPYVSQGFLVTQAYDTTIL